MKVGREEVSDTRTDDTLVYLSWDFPGQIEEFDGPEDNGSMRVGFIVLGNPDVTGSIRVDRTKEDTDSTRSEMTDLL
jgi:hypothetical protein